MLSVHAQCTLQQGLYIHHLESIFRGSHRGRLLLRSSSTFVIHARWHRPRRRRLGHTRNGIFKDSIESSTNGLGLQAPELPVGRRTCLFPKHNTTDTCWKFVALFKCSGNPCIQSITTYLQEVNTEICMQTKCGYTYVLALLFRPRLTVFCSKLRLGVQQFSRVICSGARSATRMCNLHIVHLSA
jgi:hypothetical protein